MSELKVTKKEQGQRELGERIGEMREWLKPGMEVYGKVESVSSSGMSRRISFYIVDDGKIRDITWNIARVLGYRVNTSNMGGLLVSGCGMDMVHHVVYELSRGLWQGNFTCTGEGCRSNDHSNGDRNYQPHKHSDGGYALISKHL